VLVLRATIAKKENGRRQRKHARSTTRKKVNAKSGTPENTVIFTVRNKTHVEPGTPETTVDNTTRREVLAELGTPENIAVITARKKVLAKLGTPESTAVNTVRRKNVTGLKREQAGLKFLTPVEQNGVRRDGLSIHVAPKSVTEI